MELADIVKMYNIKLQASNKWKWVTEVMQVEMDWQISPFYSFVNPTDISEHPEHWILRYTLNNALLLSSYFLAPSVLLVFMTMPAPCIVGAA